MSRKHSGSTLNYHTVWNENNPDNPVTRGMVIHHKDGKPENDDINNLELMTFSEHRRLHMLGDKNCNYGKEFSIEHRENLSKSLKIVMANNGNPMLGKHHSEKTKNKLREILKGKMDSEETKSKKKLSHLGKHHSEETKEKIRLSNIGQKRSAESVANIKEGVRKYKDRLKEKKTAYVN